MIGIEFAMLKGYLRPGTTPYKWLRWVIKLDIPVWPDPGYYFEREVEFLEEL